MQVRTSATSALVRIGGGLVVSCQPVSGGPLDSPAMVAGFALAALQSGAKGLRIEGLENLRAVRRVTTAPIIGIIKRDLSGSLVRITPFIEDVKALSEAGADIIAFDATQRIRPVDASVLCTATRSLGRIAMADISSLAEAEAARHFGAQIIATTLAGYTGGPEPEQPDFDLLEAAARLGVPVISEGCVRTPEQARLAMRLGAHAVVVGSAITRPEHITSWFVQNAEVGQRENLSANKPVLAIDIGGTKTIVSLVSGKTVEHNFETPTLRDGKAEQWCDAIAELAGKWRGEFAVAAAAVTGNINSGKWSALNPGTLAIPDGFPLERELSSRLGVEVQCFNDAQAAAWGEYSLGAGQGSDLVFLTISSGIGGGIVRSGELITGRGGLAGSAGNLRLRHEGQLVRAEELASGFAIAARAKALGHDCDAKAVLAAATKGEGWAQTIIDEVLLHTAELLHNIQLLLDPTVIVIGGGVGLSESYIEKLNSRLALLPAAQRPEIRPAALGKFAGVIGAADLARHKSTIQGRIK
ncbi:MAG: putative N-acetylmannosamine-6-phosphate 2-epimerase [Aestuariivirga sp.]